MRSNIRNEDCEHLRAEAELARRFEAALARAADHDVRVAEVQLDAAQWLAVAVVLGEAEDASEPGASIGEVAIAKMCEDRGGRHGAVIHVDSIP